MPSQADTVAQFHNRDSTVRQRHDKLDLSFAPGRDALYKSLSTFRFDTPLFYGYFDDLVWFVMFDRTDGIRFTHSPSGGGGNAALKTTNPASESKGGWACMDAT